MNRYYLILALLTAISCPVAAHATSCTASTCDVITIKQVGTPANVYTFTVPDNPIPAAFDTSLSDAYFELTGIAATGPLGYSAANDTLFFYPAVPTYANDNGTGSLFGGLCDMNLANSAQSGLSSLYGFCAVDATFFSGSVSSPSFALTPLTTTAPLNNGYYAGPETYNYSITAYSGVASTPEPSSLVLLGTGALGLVSAWRRRRLA
jgi:hypothetical protein